MIARTFAAVAAAETLIAAAVIGIGVGAETTVAIGVATFGACWYGPLVIDRIRGR